MSKKVDEYKKTLVADMEEITFGIPHTSHAPFERKAFIEGFRVGIALQKEWMLAMLEKV